MNKKSMGAIVITLSLMSSIAYAGFERKNTSEAEDRRAMTEASKEQSKLLKELITETKKTNELLKKYMGTDSKRDGGRNASRSDGAAYMEDSDDEEQQHRIRRTR